MLFRRDGSSSRSGGRYCVKFLVCLQPTHRPAHAMYQLRADEECRSLWFFLLLQLQTLVNFEHLHGWCEHWCYNLAVVLKASSMTFLLIGAACATLAIAEFVGALVSFSRHESVETSCRFTTL